MPQLPLLKVLAVLGAIGAIAAAAPTARADNINPPSYVGQPCSTHFEASVGGIVFTAVENLCPFTLFPEEPLFDSPSDGLFVIGLPNFIDDLPVKLIRIQLTAFPVEELDDPPVPFIDILGLDQTVDEVATIFVGGFAEFPCLACTTGIVYFLSDWELRPNPDAEFFLIRFDPEFLTPTQIVIDTISTSEPGLIVLFGLGLAALALARRRRTS